MSAWETIRSLDLGARRTGAEYLKLYRDFKAVANAEDQGPCDVLRRGGEVSLSQGSVYRTGPEDSEEISLSYQRPDVIAAEDLTLRRAAFTAEVYECQTLQFGREGSLLKVTQSRDLTRDEYGDELRTVLYVDPTSEQTYEGFSAPRP